MKTETTATTEDITIPTTAASVPFNRNLLAPGNHAATIISAEMVRNHNGKLSLELDCEVDGRRLQHNMYCTTPNGTANTAKQIKNAFGVESFKNIGDIVGQACKLRIEHEEYNGRTQVRVAYVNPQGSVSADDVNLDELDAGFTAVETTIEF